ncbi:hypothetical protein cyc_03762 [Cyclospora cayetanensis]|uniref:Uncharacterized protein n=1 Tax=Cyclospora cayetanensis TaxID=88456 RepID=A0A1D3CY18_9EIME|nr:hypothetical protein cyc_03762 [Cyclospora cayetanensis]
MDTVANNEEYYARSHTSSAVGAAAAAAFVVSAAAAAGYDPIETVAAVTAAAYRHFLPGFNINTEILVSLLVSARFAAIAAAQAVAAAKIPKSGISCTVSI